MMPEFHAGDLLFFYGTGWKSRVIEAATLGPSHVGMIFVYRDQPMLIESTTLCDLPCQICGEASGVHARRPEARIASYDGKVFHSAIRKPRRFHREQSSQLTATILGQYHGLPYDMAGAIESPTVLALAQYPDFGSLFCSALCADLLQGFAKGAAGKNPKRVTPAGLARITRRQGSHLPMTEVRV